MPRDTGKILEIQESGPLRAARVQFGGIVRQVSLDFVPEAGLGDYVMVHVGFAISRVDSARSRAHLQASARDGSAGSGVAPRRNVDLP